MTEALGRTGKASILHSPVLRQAARAIFVFEVEVGRRKNNEKLIAILEDLVKAIHEEPYPGIKINILLGQLKTATDPASQQTLDDCPPPEQWRAWRMARIGAGWPRVEEIARACEFARSKEINSAGLSRRAVLDVMGKTDYDLTSVSTWVRRCWDYLLEGGNQELVTERADLTFLQWVRLDFQIEHERERRTKRVKISQ